MSLRAQEVELRRQAANALTAILAQVPTIKVKGVVLDVPDSHSGADIRVQLTVGGRHHELLCKLESSGQPRYVRMGMSQLRSHEAVGTKKVTPILIAPYLSPQAQSLCREHEVGFLDLEGNCRLLFAGVFIERQVLTRPSSERRELKSLFKPKSAQVLRALLRDPRRAWRVVELAEAAAVSLGHVSNVRTALLGQEWAAVASDGLSLTNPDALLDAWRDVYESPKGQRIGFYTTLHGGAFEEAARRAVIAANQGEAAVLASFSAAQWWAPYARVGTHFFYTDPAGLDVLQQELKLSSVSTGENVVILRLEDGGLFRDQVEIAAGVVCTSPVQTYLDLWIAGERGREAAHHLRQEKMAWTR